MLKTKETADRDGGGRRPDRSSLAEIRRSYLMRQPAIGDRYPPTGRKPVSIAPDRYDYAPAFGGHQHRTYKRFTIEQPPPLPYYVVPVLYVPQKAVSQSTEGMGRARPPAIERREDALRRRATAEAPPGYDRFVGARDAQSDSECDSRQEGLADGPRSNSATSTVNGGSSLSSRPDDVSESQPGAKADRAPSVTGRLSPGVYKYPTGEKAFRNVYRPPVFPISPGYRGYHELFTNGLTSAGRGRGPPRKRAPHPKDAYGDCADALWGYEAAREELSNRKVVPYAESVGSESTRSRDPAGPKRRICADCLKGKCADGGGVEDFLSEGGGRPGGYSPRATKSTQTFSATKITSATQTEVQVEIQDDDEDGADVEVLLLDRSSAKGIVGEPMIRGNAGGHRIRGKVSLIPQLAPHEFRSLYTDLVRHKLTRTRVPCERNATKRKKNDSA